MKNTITSLTKEQFKATFAGYKPSKFVSPPKTEGCKYYIMFIKNKDEKLPVSIAKGVDHTLSVKEILADAEFGCFPIKDNKTAYFVSNNGLLGDDEW